MTVAVPWVEVAVAVPLLAAGWAALVRRAELAHRIALWACVLALAATVAAWVEFARGTPDTGLTVLAVDTLSAPLLPAVALLHVLTVLATGRAKRTRVLYPVVLAGLGVRLATYACASPWPLIALLAVGALPPLLELRERGRPVRLYALHMGLFVGLLVVGWATGASVLVLLAVLIRCGTVPFHTWVPDLFEHGSFAGSLVAVVPLVGVYAALRLVLPVAPEWALASLSVMSLVTALYAAGMAVVQADARRGFAYLFLSMGSLVLVGLELHTAVSLTGALSLWLSVLLAVGGLGLVLRAVEARFGRLSLDRFHGLYDHSPTLAVGFLLTGLGAVGFPGTVGFVAAEVLVDGAVEANLWVGVVVAVAAALNGIAVVRAYLAVFTGGRDVSAVPLGITPRERLAVLTLAGLVLVGGLVPQPGIADRHAAAVELLRQRAKMIGG